MMNDTIYQNIFDELNKYLVKGWEKLVVYLEYGIASYSFSFYIKVDNKFIKCYDLPNVSDDELLNTFSSIDTVVSKERCKAKDLWSNMTMIVDNEGNMHTDFDYTNLSQGTYEYKKNWKSKYLV